MNRRKFALFFAIAVSGLFIGKSVSPEKRPPVESVNETSVAALEEKKPSAPEEEFELKLFEGRLFLYRFSDGERHLIRSCDSPSLRENDIAALAKGVKVASLSEALMLLEDFTS